LAVFGIGFGNWGRPCAFRLEMQLNKKMVKKMRQNILTMLDYGIASKVIPRFCCFGNILVLTKNIIDFERKLPILILTYRGCWKNFHSLTSK
jgi:hypothetical protein